MAHKNSKKLSFIGENIKKIRQVKRISQAEFSSLFNLARPSIGAYEEGRSEPKIETIIQIANYFRISIDLLLTRKLTVSDIYSMGLLNEKLNKAHNIKPEALSLPERPLPAGIRLIKVRQYLEYVVNYNTLDFIQKLPEILLPIEEPHKYRAFEMNGSEMEYHQQGLHHGDILVGSPVDKMSIAQTMSKIIAVVHHDGILTRRLSHTTADSITLTADDPNYPDMIMPAKEIHEIWQIQYVFSSYLNPPSLLEERVLRLEKELERIKDKI